MKGRSHELPDKVAETLTSYGKGTQSFRNKKKLTDQLQDRIEKFDATEELPEDLSKVEISVNEAKVVGKRLLEDSIAQQAQRYTEYSALDNPRRTRAVPEPDKKRKIKFISSKVKMERERQKQQEEEQEQERQRTPIVATKKIKSAKTGGGDVMDIQTFQEMDVADDMEHKFRERMKRLNRQPDDVYTRIPEQEDDFSFVAEVKSRETMFAQVASMIENNKEIPDLPLVTRVRMADLLRAPIESKNERGCVYRDKCECFQTWGFVCREMISEELEDSVLEILSVGGDVSSVMPHYIDMCVVCNLRITTELYDNQKAGLSPDEPCVIHSFKVIVDTEGEYPSEKTLLGDDEFCGVIAPIIRYDRSNYLKTAPQGVDALVERACLDFREGAVSL